MTRALPTGELDSVAYSELYALYVAIFRIDGHRTLIRTSTDGQIWTDWPLFGYCTSMRWSRHAGVFFADYTADNILASPDGHTWQVWDRARARRELGLPV